MAVPGYVKRFPVEGEAANIVSMRDKEGAIFDGGIAMTAKARLQSSMEVYCEHGPGALPDSLFKFLQHFQHGGVKVRLEEFKAKAVRLLGFRADDEGQSTFFVTGSETNKKGTKVNPASIAAAGREAVTIVGILRKRASAMKEKK